MNVFQRAARVLKVSGVAASLTIAVVPITALAQTDAQKSALASAIQTASDSVAGTDDAATAARASAVKSAIDTFVKNNGIDGSVVSALVSGALGLVPTSVSSRPGVATAASTEAAALRTASAIQTNSTIQNSATTQSANPSQSSSSGSGSGGGGGGGGGGGSTPYGVH